MPEGGNNPGEKKYENWWNFYEKLRNFAIAMGLEKNRKNRYR